MECRSLRPTWWYCTDSRRYECEISHLRGHASRLSSLTAALYHCHGRRTRDIQRSTPWTLLYADDFMLLSENKDDLERQTQASCDPTAMFGLRINVKKIEYMRPMRTTPPIFTFTPTTFQKSTSTSNSQLMIAYPTKFSLALTLHCWNGSRWQEFYAKKKISECFMSRVYQFVFKVQRYMVQSALEPLMIWKPFSAWWTWGCYDGWLASRAQTDCRQASRIPPLMVLIRLHANDNTVKNRPRSWSTGKTTG